MDRAFSVDDIVGGIWKLSGNVGFPRTDSEAAFQDFLKRIPSTTNLTQQSRGQSLDQQQVFQLHQQLHQAHTTLPVSTSDSVGCVLGDNGTPLLGGIPRVPSLDFLRQLVHVNQALQGQTPKVAASTSGKAKGNLDGLYKPSNRQQEEVEPTASSSAALAFSMPQALTAPLVPSVSTAPGVMLPVSSGPSNHSGLENGDGKEVSKSEVRRARRMLSNRESARRSRRRKQEHLMTLEEQVAEITRERDALQEEYEDATAETKKKELENQKLRKEVEELKGTIARLETEKNALGKRLQRSTSLQKMNSAEGLPKRVCNGNGERGELHLNAIS